MMHVVPRTQLPPPFIGSRWPCEPMDRGSAVGEVRQDVFVAAVAQVFGVARTDLARPTRGRARVALARQVAMYLAHVACGLRLTDVGRLFARDRTTVAHACAVVEDLRDDPVFDRALELLEWASVSLATPRGSRLDLA